ncbi:MAG: dihydrofolate reductase [Pseudomonadota bacterium]|nr:dihydrofolate reductase [Pseudomonadota bacterium]
MDSKIVLVVAMNHDNVIGVNNQLPWHIPEDLAYFKNITMGKPIVMGRKTFESIGRALPGRINIVVTRNTSWQYENVKVFASLAQALKEMKTYPEICVIGGGEIFNQTLPIADVLHITTVDVAIDKPDTFFPEFDTDQEWQLIEQHEIISKNNNIKCQFSQYVRKLRFIK